MRTIKTQLPEGFGVTPLMRSWAERECPSVDIDRQHAIFCDYWIGHGTAMANWVATWRNWMRRAPEFTRLPPNTWRAPAQPRKAAKECIHGLPAYSCFHCRQANRHGSTI